MAQVFINRLVIAMPAMSGPREIFTRLVVEAEHKRTTISDTGFGTSPETWPSSVRLVCPPRTRVGAGTGVARSISEGSCRITMGTWGTAPRRPGASFTMACRLTSRRGPRGVEVRGNCQDGRDGGMAKS